MAHPDDAEIFCAGTLALLQELGWGIYIASMTPGDCGSKDRSPSEIAGIRRREAHEAAAKLRAPYACLDRRDLRVRYDDATVDAAVELIRDVDPEIVFTHPPHDYMPDHELTSLAARAACFAAPAPNYDTGRRPASGPTARIPWLYYASPAGGSNIFGEPAPSSVVVDVSSVIGLKSDMLACHASQREWLAAQHGMDHYVEEMKRWSTEAGRAAGFAYGEAFRQHIGHPYPAEDRLVEALGERARPSGSR